MSLWRWMTHVPVESDSARKLGGRIPSWLRIAGTYALGMVIVLWVARGISMSRLIHDLARARLAMFIPVCLSSVIIWVAGDTWLYARLISYFHRPTSSRELLPAMIVHEFIQALNGVAAGTALALMIQRRKQVDFIVVGGALMFQGFIDLQVMAAVMALTATVAAPVPMPELSWRYPAVFLAMSFLFVGFCLRGSRLALARWTYIGPLLAVLRRARAADYLKLAAIRAAIFGLQGVVLYLELLSFGIRVPMGAVMVALPAVLIAAALPIVPSGLGPRQAAIVTIFQRFGPRAPLLAMALAHTGLVMLVRLVLGLFSTDLIAREVLVSKPRCATCSSQATSLSADKAGSHRCNGAFDTVLTRRR